MSELWQGLDLEKARAEYESSPNRMETMKAFRKVTGKSNFEILRALFGAGESEESAEPAEIAETEVPEKPAELQRERRTRKPFTPEEDAVIKEGRLQGLTYAQIAEKLGRGETMVAKRMALIRAKQRGDKPGKRESEDALTGLLKKIDRLVADERELSEALERKRAELAEIREKLRDAMNLIGGEDDEK